VLPIFYYRMLSMSPLLRYRVTDCYPHCSLFTTSRSFIVCIFRGVKNYGPGGWGPWMPGGGLVPCTTCTTYC